MHDSTKSNDRVEWILEELRITAEWARNFGLGLPSAEMTGNWASHYESGERRFPHLADRVSKLHRETYNHLSKHA